MKKGFTLIELLVVIVITGILIGIASTSYVRATQSARDSKRKTDLEQLRQALETYRSENGAYPYLNWRESYVYKWNLYTPVMAPDYISTLPSDPKKDPEYAYRYVTPAATLTPSTYSLCAYLEVDPGMSLSSCAGKPCGSQATCNYEVTNP